MIPRVFWWTLLGLALLNFAWNTWTFLFDRPHAHRDAAVANFLIIALTIRRLAYPPNTVA